MIEFHRSASQRYRGAARAVRRLCGFALVHPSEGPFCLGRAASTAARASAAAESAARSASSQSTIGVVRITQSVSAVQSAVSRTITKLILVAGTVLLLGLLAGALPAIGAMRLKITDALRRN